VCNETPGKNRCQLHTGNSKCAQATPRNAVLNPGEAAKVKVLHNHGLACIPAVTRHFGASEPELLERLGTPAP